MSENNAHHLFGPSSLARRELCPASARLEKDLPSFDTEDAKEGTLLHAEIAATIEKALSADETIRIDDELIGAMFDKFVEVACGSAGSIDKLKSEDTLDIYTEQPVEYKYCGIVQYSGTADVLIVTEDSVIVIDWKTGHRAVEGAENNTQTAAYALAAMQQFKRTKADVFIFNPVIHQDSHATFSDPEPLKRYIMGIIADCNDPEAPIVPGEEQCRYCKAAHHGTCPALAKTAELTAQKAEEIVPLPALSVLTVDDLCEYKRKCDLIGKFADRVDAELRRRIEENGACGPWQLKETSGGREITDINIAFQESGIPADLFLRSCTCSISKLEKEYITYKGDAFKTQKEAKADLNSKLCEVIADKPKKKTLVRVSA